MNAKDIKLINNKIEASKVKIGKERDKLRELADELDTILECLVGAKEDFEAAKTYLNSAIDKISEQV